MKPTFTPLADPPGIRIRDPIETAQLELHTDREVQPVTADGDDFVLPVDGAVYVDANRVEIPRLLDVYLRDGDGNLVGESSNNQRVTYDPRSYTIDISTGQMKLLFGVDGEVSVSRQDRATVLEFAEEDTVAIGARSLHESPAATITVGDDIEDAMRAVSLFGSALKTTSPERSFPTLRGHPPLVEYGDGFHAPDGIEAPDTDVTIEIPRSYADLYRVSSLAYYLGADVRPGPERALVVGGERRPFDRSVDFETAVTRLLKRVFFLDCVTRTEGLYRVKLAEREAVEPALSFDPATAYAQSFADRLLAYLDVPYDAIEAHVPQWKLTTDVADDASNLSVLPFAANELSIVRIPRSRDSTVHQSEPEELTSFYRDSGVLVRSASTSTQSTDNIVKPRESESIEHAWVGDGFPLGASKMTPASYRQRLARDITDSSRISIRIVCNDPEMSEEDVVEEFYGARDFFEFDISVYYELTKDELADELASDVDFLHYIGHVDDDGFQCADGMLDARTLDTVGVEAFLLNACRSYEQGEALVDKGSLGGIVTLSKICNDPAVRMGQALARLLNLGFSLQSGLSVARNVTLFGNQYITIGDGSLQLIQNNSGTPLSIHLSRNGDVFDVDVYGYPTKTASMGSFLTLHVNDSNRRYLNSGKIASFTLPPSEVEHFFDLGLLPVFYEDELYWTEDFLSGEIL